MDCKLCGKDLKEERRRHFVCSVSTSTKIAIDSALWHEGRGYLEFINSQTDGYVCTREKRTRGETCRPFSFSIAHRMPKAKWRNRVTFHTQLEGKRSHPDHRERLPLFVAVRLSVYNNPYVHPLSYCTPAIVIDYE